MNLALNLGCHDIHIAGFVNIDNDPAMQPDLLFDATKLDDIYEQDTVDFVYAGHFFEHFPVAEGRAIASMLHSIIRPYGAVMAVIPDYTKIDDLPIDEQERIIMAEGTHKAIYDTERLIGVLSKAGFVALEVPITSVPWCRFREVKWQSAVLAMKCPPVTFPKG